MKVWIDQDLCTGDGLCTDHAPAVFTLLEDGIAYVKQSGRVLNDPGSAGSLASVPPATRTRRRPGGRGLPGRVHLHRVDRRPSAAPYLGNTDESAK